ncbi:hypothetical protein D3C71_1309380 [compost metagenome]
MNGMLAARRETRLFTSSNGCRYGRCTIKKKACSNGSVISAAIWVTMPKSSSSRWGRAMGW